jgi:CysZ protein
MKFFKDIGTGISAYYRSFEFIFKNNLWFYFFFPALIAVAIFYSGDALRHDLENVSFQAMHPDDPYQYLIVGLKAIFVFAALKLDKVMVIIILSPVLALLSARTEKILAGNTYPFEFTQFLKDINRGIGIALRNAAIQLLYIGGWLVLSIFVGELLPYTGWFIFVLGFYFYGFSLIDYINERKKLNLEQSVKFIRSHFGLTVIIGGIFSALFLIPYAGVIIAPVTGIVAANIGVHKIVDMREYGVGEKKGLSEDKLTI